MADQIVFESRAERINMEIESAVNTIRKKKKIHLPEINEPIVQSFVEKLEGTYAVNRAKKDTDHAIDLLYIAYNTTPQEEADIRIKISAIMDKLIKVQMDSELAMKEALHISKNIVGALKETFVDWLDTKEGNDPKEIKGFVKKDLLKLASDIKGKALHVKDVLLEIAKTYDSIIKDTVTTTATSETTLGSRLKEKATLEKDIAEANAKREQLESLVKDLQEEVTKFDKMARDYESRAQTAEDRAFIMSIVRVGAQMISAAIPAIAMASGGSGSFLAASTLNTVGQGGTAKSSTEKDDSAGGDNTTEVIKTKTKISENKMAMKASETIKTDLTAKIKNLEAEKTKLLSAKGENKEISSTEISELDKRIETTKTDLKTEEEKYSKLGTVLAGLKESLAAMEKGLEKLTDEQQDQAKSLREMQMKMLDKVEAYQKEKREQAAELVKINALLIGKRTEDEKIQLAIKSLNLSLTALKRMKEIIEELAFFFKSFADFMGEVATEATDQLTSIEKAVAMKTIRENRLARLIESTDEFFIKQTGEWNAVTVVSDKFIQNFANGWSKLNKLNGEYKSEEKLKTYSVTASATITAIAEEREAEANQKIADIEGFRKRISTGSAGA